MSLLFCENVSVGYGDEIVCKDISFSVEKGDYLCIVGENGSGKSTLLRTILGLNQPLNGTLHMDDELLYGGIGYLPQNTAIREDFPATVREIVRSGLLPSMGKRFFYGKREKELAEKSMARFGILSLAGKSYTKLSGGQKQRVLLARTLACEKNLLVLDEPTAGLDANVTEQLYELIHYLNQEGQTIIMVSHDQHAVERYAKTILTVSDGYATMKEAR